MIFSSLFYAFLVPLLKKAGKDIPVFTSMAVPMFVLFSCALAASLFFEKDALPKLLVQKNSLLILILLGVLNFFGFWLLIIGSKSLLAWQVNMFGILTPMLTGIIAFFILGESLTVNLFIGLAIAGIGLYIAVR